LLPGFWWMVCWAALTGMFFGSVNPIANLAMQNRTPERLRGRVIGVMGSAAYVAGPLGYLVAGPLIDAIGVRSTFLGIAVVLLAVTICSAFLRSLRGLDDPPVSDKDSGATSGTVVERSPGAT
ncbi:MAG: MFS transporter, partial [Nocardioides sp.]